MALDDDSSVAWGVLGKEHDKNISLLLSSNTPAILKTPQLYNKVIISCIAISY